jgi:hypothetical protein
VRDGLVDALGHDLKRLLRDQLMREQTPCEEPREQKPSGTWAEALHDFFIGL